MGGSILSGQINLHLFVSFAISDQSKIGKVQIDELNQQSCIIQFKQLHKQNNIIFIDTQSVAILNAKIS